jgi:hypothetical protein
VPPDRIVKAVDVAADGSLGVLPGHKYRPPDKFRFQGFEEGLDNGVDAPISVKRL